MGEQDGSQESVSHSPSTMDPEAWEAYWEAQGQACRTEPEIDEERQKYLDERRSITSDIKQGIYPFKDIKLNRADVEWLLATYENGRGPVDWSDESQREREGLDLCGADLCQANLNRLPLSRIRGGLTREQSSLSTKEQSDKAAVRFEAANLVETQLQGAKLNGADLSGVNLFLALQLHL